MQCALLALAGLVSPAPDVIDVAPIGGDFSTIRDAVAAAVDGDVIRVAPGTYPYFGVFGKSLRIYAIQPHTVDVLGTVRVQELALGQVTVLDGLNVRPLDPSMDPALIVAGCDGAVRIHRSSFGGSTPEHLASYTAKILDSEDVLLEDVRIYSGAECNSSYCLAHDALNIDRSLVHLYDSVINAQWYGSLVGSTAIRAHDSTLLLSGGAVSLLVGGDIGGLFVGSLGPKEEGRALGFETWMLLDSPVRGLALAEETYLAQDGSTVVAQEVAVGSEDGSFQWVLCTPRGPASTTLGLGLDCEAQLGGVAYGAGVGALVWDRGGRLYRHCSVHNVPISGRADAAYQTLRDRGISAAVAFDLDPARPGLQVACAGDKGFISVIDVDAGFDLKAQVTPVARDSADVRGLAGGSFSGLGHGLVSCGDSGDVLVLVRRE